MVRTKKIAFVLRMSFNVVNVDEVKIVKGYEMSKYFTAYQKQKNLMTKSIVGMKKTTGNCSVTLFYTGGAKMPHLLFFCDKSQQTNIFLNYFAFESNLFKNNS